MQQPLPPGMRVQYRVIRRVVPTPEHPFTVQFTQYSDMWEGALELQPRDKVMVHAPDADGPFSVDRLDDTGAVATVELTTPSGRPCTLMWIRDDASLQFHTLEQRASRFTDHALSVMFTANAGRAAEIWHFSG